MWCWEPRTQWQPRIDFIGHSTRPSSTRKAWSNIWPGGGQDLFGAKCDLLLYDLTSTYFEGQAGEIPIARRGYSRDHRPDALQIILALVVTEEGFPLSYEVFEGNRADVTTLEEILDSVERKHGALSRVWIFDRGIVSE